MLIVGGIIRGFGDNSRRENSRISPTYARLRYGAILKLKGGWTFPVLETIHRFRLQIKYYLFNSNIIDRENEFNQKFKMAVGELTRGKNYTCNLLFTFLNNLIIIICFC